MDAWADFLPADPAGFFSAISGPCGEWLAFGVMLGLVFWALGLGFYVLIDLLRGGV